MHGQHILEICILSFRHKLVLGTTLIHQITMKSSGKWTGLGQFLHGTR